MFFSVAGKIIIATGDSPVGFGSQHTEVIDLTNSIIKYDLLQTLPERWGSVGALMNGKPVICGGYNTSDNEYLQDILVLGNDENQSSFNLSLTEKRSGAASVLLDDYTLWIVGGDAGFQDLRSTEFLSLDKPPEEGPYLPFTIERHGMVHYTPEAIYLIGGYQDGVLSNKTWIVDLTDGFKIFEGPSLKIARCSHATGKMVVNGKTLIVVAGGEFRQGRSTDSVEILDPMSKDGWVTGIPFGF